MIGSIIHTLSPFAIEISPGFGPRWYGLSYAAGFLVAWLLLRWLSRTGRTPLSTSQVTDLLTFLVVGVVIGGRVGHVIFYDRALLWTFSESFPWWGLLALHKGGMSSHGGIIGVILCAMWYGRRQGIPMLHAVDLSAFVAPPGLCFGRLANWVNGELWGKPLPADWQANPPWWSVKYPAQVLQPDFPVQSLAPLAPLVDPALPLPEAVYRAAYLKRPEVLAQLEPLLTAYWPNNFMQAITDGPLLFGALCIAWWKPERPGVVSAWFLIAYGVLRVGTEQLRAPDAEAFSIGPVTEPMLLSVAMIAAGAVLLAAVSRSAAMPLGGIVRRS